MANFDLFYFQNKVIKCISI